LIAKKGFVKVYCCEKKVPVLYCKTWIVLLAVFAILLVINSLGLLSRISGTVPVSGLPDNGAMGITELN
jgi:hypothetical protein